MPHDKKIPLSATHYWGKCWTERVHEECMRFDAMYAINTIPESSVLKRISIRYSGDTYSFQCGMQLLMWGENV